MIEHYFRTSGVEKIIPDLGNSPQVTPGAGVWGVWAQLIAATASPFTLCGILAAWRFVGDVAGNPACIGQLQVGQGAAAFEVPIGQAGFAIGMITIPVDGGDMLLPQICTYTPVKPVLIAAGTRLAARGANIHNVTLMAAYVLGYEGWEPPANYYPDLDETYSRGIIGDRSRIYPDAARTLTTSGVGAWNLGAWTQFIAATPAPTLVRGIVMCSNTMALVGRMPQFEVGVGAIGLEVTVSRGGLACPGTGPTGGFCPLPRPYLVKKGERVSVRVADNAGNLVWQTCLAVEELT